MIEARLTIKLEKLLLYLICVLTTLELFGGEPVLEFEGQPLFED